MQSSKLHTGVQKKKNNDMVIQKGQNHNEEGHFSVYSEKHNLSPW